jgi:hypothetical protein
MASPSQEERELSGQRRPFLVDRWEREAGKKKRSRKGSYNFFSEDLRWEPSRRGDPWTTPCSSSSHDDVHSLWPNPWFLFSDEADAMESGDSRGSQFSTRSYPRRHRRRQRSRKKDVHTSCPSVLALSDCSRPVTLYSHTCAWVLGLFIGGAEHGRASLGDEKRFANDDENHDPPRSGPGTPRIRWGCSELPAYGSVRSTAGEWGGMGVLGRLPDLWFLTCDLGAFIVLVKVAVAVPPSSTGYVLPFIAGCAVSCIGLSYMGLVIYALIRH